MAFTSAKQLFQLGWLAIPWVFMFGMHWASCQWVFISVVHFGVIAAAQGGGTSVRWSAKMHRMLPPLLKELELPLR